MTELHTLRGRSRICVHSACNYPEAQCMGTCGLLHRVNTHHLPDDRAAVVLGSTEEPAPISRARLALNTWTLYRRAGCGIRESFRNARRAFRQRT